VAQKAGGADMTKLIVAGGFLALNLYTYHFLATREEYPPRTPFSEFPLELGEWSCGEPEEMEAKVQRNLRVTDYLICSYRRATKHDFVNVYVGYHASQVRTGGGGGETSSVIHPPRHCLPGSGWDIIASEVAPLELPDPGTIYVNRLIIAKGETRALVYYWYQSRGRVIAEDWKKVLYQFWDRATRLRTDGSLVRFTVPIVRGDVDRADATILDLASQMVPMLPSFVPN
jgi:EpsI family protein